MNSGRCPLLKYVGFAAVEDHLRLGWMALAPLGEWSILMGWPCQCEPADSGWPASGIETEAPRGIQTSTPHGRRGRAMTMLAYDAVRDFELRDLVDALHRAAVVLADLEAGVPAHRLGVAPAAAAIGAAICTLSNFRLALHDKREPQNPRGIAP
jgi:hypothetical protein